jgi:hypothetical protein
MRKIRPTEHPPSIIVRYRHKTCGLYYWKCNSMLRRFGGADLYVTV